jgi:hypothetical protein
MMLHLTTAQTVAGVLVALGLSAALSACGGDRGPQSPDLVRLGQYASCMRGHGVDDWPDPDAHGVFHLQPTLWANLKSGPRWPVIEAAWNTCKHFVPTGHISSTQA